MDLGLWNSSKEQADSSDGIVRSKPPGWRTSKLAGGPEQISVLPNATTADSGGTADVLFMIQQNLTPLLGYSLDVQVAPIGKASGTVTANPVLTNFFETQNLIVAGGAQLDPVFSVVLDMGDGSLFINAITEDNSTILATDAINDVLAQVFFDASLDACGNFTVELGPASALSDAEAFAVPFAFEPGVIHVRTADCRADLDCNGEVRVPDLIILLGGWGPNPGHPADLDGNGEVRVPDLIILLSGWGACP